LRRPQLVDSPLDLSAMADLLSPETVDEELAATADYDVANDVNKAVRRVAALRRKLDFPQQMSRFGEESMQIAVEATERQLQQALAWLASQGMPTEAGRLSNPSVVHADFRTFRGYQ
jgi:hypothetical protein